MSLSQVSEFQDAITHNAESIRTLATQLQQVINDLDSGSAKIEREIKTLTRLALLAIALSVFAVILSLYSWVR